MAKSSTNYFWWNIFLWCNSCPFLSTMHTHTHRHTFQWPQLTLQCLFPPAPNRKDSDYKHTAIIYEATAMNPVQILFVKRSPRMIQMFEELMKYKWLLKDVDGPLAISNFDAELNLKTRYILTFTITIYIHTLRETHTHFMMKMTDIQSLSIPPVCACRHCSWVTELSIWFSDMYPAIFENTDAAGYNQTHQIQLLYQWTSISDTNTQRLLSWRTGQQQFIMQPAATMV